MVNPILAMLQPNGGRNNMMSLLSTVKGIMSGNPAQAFESEMKNNPQFAKFVQDHKNMTVNDLMNQSGIDPNMIQMLLK